MIVSLLAVTHRGHIDITRRGRWVTSIVLVVVPSHLKDIVSLTSATTSLPYRQPTHRNRSASPFPPHVETSRVTTRTCMICQSPTIASHHRLVVASLCLVLPTRRRSLQGLVIVLLLVVARNLLLERNLMISMNMHSLLLILLQHAPCCETLMRTTLLN